MPNKLEQLKLKSEKNIGIKKHAGKVRKIMFLNPNIFFQFEL